MVMRTPRDRAKRLRVAADVGRLAALRAFVRSSATSFGASEQIADDLVQAVDEAACNIVLHGYHGSPGVIEAEAALRNGNIEIRLLDRGRAFDPTAVPPPDLTVPPMARKPGGMGVHLMRAGTDAVHHRARPGGGNELTLVRAIEPQTRRTQRCR
jgi:serine/threonine-protein kinase RsbW